MDSIDSVKESWSKMTLDEMLSIDHLPSVCRKLAIAFYFLARPRSCHINVRRSREASEST